MFIMRYITEKDIRYFLKCGRSDAKRILNQLIEIQNDHPEYDSPKETVNPAIFFMVFGKALGLK